MKKLSKTPFPKARLAAAIIAALGSGQALAFQIDTGNPDVKMRWDNTIKYSTIYRVKDPDATQIADYVASPAGDGNRNFNKGIASNRLDLLSELDLTAGNFGGRISGSAWYDYVYHQANDNKTGLGHNLDTPLNKFNSETKKEVGQGGRLMDAFVFAKGSIGDMPASVRLGQHAVIYGETLMSGANGIAAAQGPLDIIKAATVPGAQVKEFLLPVPQISVTLQPSNQFSLGAYYQFKWVKSSFFPAGSFLSPNDVMGPGAQSFLDVFPVARTSDIKPKDGGQWGVQMHYKPEALDVDLGFYAANYHDKTPSAIYVNVGSNPALGGAIAPTTFTRVYQENIKTYGISASTVLGSDNVSLEVSARDNMPLTGGLCGQNVQSGCGYFLNTITLLGGPTYDNKDKPAYAVGKTLHATLVDIHLFQPNALLKDGGSLALQFDWHTVNKVTKNPTKIDQTTTRSAYQLTAAFNADYFQVLDGLDISIPIVLQYSKGRSRAYIGWVENGGSVDVGLNFKYLGDWKGGINYHHFLGSHGANIGNGKFNQTQFDRNYLSFNLSRSF